MKRSALRRYPALAFLVAAGLLALLLPSGLIVPQSGPPTLAEYAPVPGEGARRSDVSNLGGTSSGGLGAGGSGGAEDRAVVAPGRVTRKPGTKRCVGKPPRQTEDLLSPPCIAFFDGDNGGATSKGVTRDEIRIVVYMSEATPSRFEDCAPAPVPEELPEIVACKAYSRYFNDRYQTYGRTVHVWAYYGDHNSAEVGIENGRSPFGVYMSGGTGIERLTERLGNRQIITAAYIGNERQRHRDLAPYLIGYRPDTEDDASIVATYVCAKLKDRLAKYAGTPDLQAKTRVFGILESAKDYAPILKTQLKKQCDINIAATGDATRASGEVSKQSAAGVTSILVRAGTGNLNLQTRDATQQRYFPEWLVAGDPYTGGQDTNSGARLFDPVQWRHAFGLTFDYRRDAIEQQSWYRAYREGCPDCPAPGRGTFVAYDVLTQMFYGIQAAGPRLTPQNFDRGLHSIPQQGSTSPYRPAAYFAPGNYTFVKDAMEIWWDATGQAPGDSQLGCYRIPNQGARKRSGEWDAGDDSIQRQENAPCQGSTS